MLNALIRARMAAMYSSIFRWTKGNEKHNRLNKVMIILIGLIVSGSFLTIFTFLFTKICPPLLQSDLGWLYFSLVGLMSFIILFASSVLMAQSQLFETKDNELLLSMPIPSRLILTARISALLMMNYVLEALIMIPAGMVYFTNTQISLEVILYFSVVFLFLPLPSLALSGIFGWLLAYISSKVQNKSLIVTTLSIGFLLLYFYVFSKMNDYVGYLVANGAAVADAVRRVLFPAYHLGNAIAKSSYLSLLYFILCAAVPFFTVYLLASTNFIYIATSHVGRSRKEYKDVPLKESGSMMALVKKELAHFFSNPAYILNASMGAIFMLIFPFTIFLKRDLLSTLGPVGLPGVADMPVLIVLLVLCSLSSINIISAPSISLEGKNLWIMQSIPVPGSDVLMSKAYAHMTICLPSVIIAATLFNFMLNMDMVMRIFLFVLPVLLTVFEAIVGVWLNLRFPKFDWISETTAIKQGISTLAAMFLPMALIAGSAATFHFMLMRLIPVELFLCLFSVLVIAMSLGILIYLKKRGGETFAALGS